MYNCKKYYIKTIDKESVEFPKSLLEINKCPKKLFYRGNWNTEIFEKTVAIIGSRKITKYGEIVLENFVPEIVANKTTVISGFMYGVDMESHRQCLNFGGKTIAVLGGGLDYFANTENYKMYEEILENKGLIISEYDPNFKPTLWSFPQRNRIVSGLSTIGVLVIEAGLKSGSLITAKYALQQKKNIFAVPGQITSRTSDGTNWLIKSGGAKMVTNPQELFGNYCDDPRQESLFRDYSNLSTLEQNIISIIENEEISMDELCRKLRVSIGELSTTISMMMMRDLIIQDKGKIYLN